MAEHTITVEYVPERREGSWHQGAHYEAKIDGRTGYGLNSWPSEVAARKAAERQVARWAADEAVRPACEAYYGRPAYFVERDLPVEVGFKVVIRSRGQMRRAIVTKVGRKNVEVAYVTEGGMKDAREHGWEATLTRKSVPSDEVYAESR